MRPSGLALFVLLASVQAQTPNCNSLEYRVAGFNLRHNPSAATASKADYRTVESAFGTPSSITKTDGATRILYEYRECVIQVDLSLDGFVTSTTYSPKGTTRAAAQSLEPQSESLLEVRRSLSNVKSALADLEKKVQALERACFASPDLPKALPLPSPSMPAPPADVPGRVVPPQTAPQASTSQAPRSSQVEAPPKAKSTPSAPAARQQCAAVTRKGTRCSRLASPGSLYCWQHQR